MTEQVHRPSPPEPAWLMPVIDAGLALLAFTLA